MYPHPSSESANNPGFLSGIRRVICRLKYGVLRRLCALAIDFHKRLEFNGNNILEANSARALP